MAGQPAPGTHSNLSFDVTELSVFDHIPAPTRLQQPLSIIPDDRDFVVEVKFEIGGIIGEHYAAGRHAYTIKVFAESIGPAAEAEIGQFRGHLIRNQLQYTEYVQVPAGTLSEFGVYKLVAVLTFDEPHPDGPLMIGFTDNPIMIQIKHRLNP